MMIFGCFKLEEDEEEPFVSLAVIIIRGSFRGSWPGWPLGDPESGEEHEVRGQSDSSCSIELVLDLLDSCGDLISLSSPWSEAVPDRFTTVRLKL